MSALLGGEYFYSTEAGVDDAFSGKEEYLNLVSNLGSAVATGAEPGEDLATISTGSVGLKVSAVKEAQLHPLTPHGVVPSARTHI